MNQGIAALSRRKSRCIDLYNSRLHLTDSESSPDYAARIFSFANATLSMNVCLGVLP